jgi:hypothetical protein
MTVLGVATQRAGGLQPSNNHLGDPTPYASGSLVKRGKNLAIARFSAQLKLDEKGK